MPAVGRRGWGRTTRDHRLLVEACVGRLDQAERLLAGKPVPDADPDDVCELLNYRSAFDFVSEYLEGGGPITEGLITEIHKLLVEGVRGESDRVIGVGPPEIVLDQQIRLFQG